MQSERRGNRLVRLLFKEKVSDRLTTGKLGRIFAGLVSRLAILTEPVLPSSRLNCERCTPTVSTSTGIIHRRGGPSLWTGVYGQLLCSSARRPCSKRGIMPGVDAFRVSFSPSRSYGPNVALTIV